MSFLVIIFLSRKVSWPHRHRFKKRPAMPEAPYDSLPSYQITGFGRALVISKVSDAGRQAGKIEAYREYVAGMSDLGQHRPSTPLRALTVIQSLICNLDIRLTLIYNQMSAFICDWPLKYLA